MGSGCRGQGVGGGEGRGGGGEGVGIWSGSRVWWGSVGGLGRGLVVVGFGCRGDGRVSRCHSIDWLPKLWLLHSTITVV